MGFSLFRQVVDEAKEFIYDADLFGGGEPLLNPEISRMVEYAKSAGLHVRLHTNATKLSRGLALELIESGLDFLSFSFDGYDKEHYERTRVNARYEETLENIRVFLEVKKSKNVSHPYTVMQAIRPHGHPERDDEAAKLAFRQQFSSLPLNEFRVIDEHNYGGKIRPVSGEGGNRYSPCTFPWYATYVLWDGSIVPCCVDWWGEYQLGRVPDTSIREAWNSQMMQSLRDKLAHRQYREVEICRHCDRLWRDRRFGIPMRDVRVLKTFLREHLIGYPKARRTNKR